jgi:hypothetical protein
LKVEIFISFSILDKFHSNAIVGILDWVHTSLA